MSGSDPEKEELEPIVLDARRLRGRNFLLGNKQGFMLHLPASNGAHARTMHRSKWYGASRLGRRYLEGLVCRTRDGRMLSRRFQRGFRTDGIVAERSYEVDSSVTERYFVPDFLPAVSWVQTGDQPTWVEPHFDLRLYRSTSVEYAYQTREMEGLVVVCRDVHMQPGKTAEGIDTGAEPMPVIESLWAAVAVLGGDAELNDHATRWRPMWYSLDAARRRYLRRLALRETVVVEHAPLWDLASEWVYAPCRIASRNGTVLALGFGESSEEAISAAKTALHSRDDLEKEKRERLRLLLKRCWFSCGHRPTDQAYSHVLSRLADCLIISNGETTKRPSGKAKAMILAGDAYFQEAWKRDENISLGGLLATGQYGIAKSVIDSTWMAQDQATGRLPLRLRVGESPGYTSSDATLWALFRLCQYVRVSGDQHTLRSKLPLVMHFFKRSLPKSRRGLLPSGSVAVAGHDWETWMDTEFSSRSGFPIEIQLLWLSSLSTFGPVVRPHDSVLADKMQHAESQLHRSLELFRHGEYFVDHLSADLRPVNLLTPNSFFWTVLGLEFDWTWEERSLALGRWELGGVSGIRTLARSQWESVLGPEISALARAGRPLPSIGKANYHRGVEWNWISQFFVAGELRHDRPDMAFDHYLARQIHDATNFAGLGGVSEVFDHRGPAGPDFQTWSMTSLLESLHRFVGVDVDVDRRHISVEPHKPRRWPYLKAKKWFGELAFDVIYVTQANRQEVHVRFLEEVRQKIMLEIALPIKPTQRVRSLEMNAVSGHQSVSWTRSERPDKVRVITPARRWQTIQLET